MKKILALAVLVLGTNAFAGTQLAFSKTTECPTTTPPATAASLTEGDVSAILVHSSTPDCVTPPPPPPPPVTPAP